MSIYTPFYLFEQKGVREYLVQNCGCQRPLNIAVPILLDLLTRRPTELKVPHVTVLS